MRGVIKLFGTVLRRSETFKCESTLGGVMSGHGAKGHGHDPLEHRLHDTDRHLDLDHLLKAYDLLEHPDTISAARKEGTKLVSSLYEVTKKHLAGVQGKDESTSPAELEHLGYKTLPGMNEAQRQSLVDDLLKRWYIAGKAHEFGKTYGEMSTRIDSMFEGIDTKDQLRDIKSYLNQKMFTPEVVQKIQQELGQPIQDAESLVQYLAGKEDVINEILGDGDSVIKRLFSSYVSNLDKRAHSQAELFPKVAKAARDGFEHFREHVNHDLAKYGLELENTPEAIGDALKMRRYLHHPDEYGAPNDPRVKGQYRHIKPLAQPEGGAHAHH